MLFSWFKSVLIVFVLCCISRAQDAIQIMHLGHSAENQETLYSPVKSDHIGGSSFIDDEMVVPPGNSSTNCTYEISDGEIQLHLQLQNETEIGLPLTALLNILYESKVNATHQFSGFISWTLFYGLDKILDFNETIAADRPPKITTVWGAFITGASFAEYEIYDDGAAGFIDNRSFVASFDGYGGGEITFDDGRPGPTFRPAPGLNRTFQGISELIEQSLNSCIDSKSYVTESTFSPSIRGLDRAQDNGHISLTYEDGSCLGCIAGVLAAQAVADFGCAVAAAFTFGIGGAVCLAAAFALATAGSRECLASNLCCPQVCGEGSLISLPPCCFGQETCLNHAVFCCSEGQTPCAGKACCNSDQSCISVGPSKGTCCPDTAVCGNSCCRYDDQICLINQICCRPDDKCGNSCCGTYGGQFFVNYHCANEVKSLCCPDGQVEVDGSGNCCLPGQKFVNGICCAPDRKNCGDDVCCPGSCENGKCVWEKTDKDCLAEGFGDGACAVHYPSYYCEYCRDGCCYYIH